MTDAELLAELADLLDRADPVPERVFAAAVAAGALLGIDWLPLELVAHAGVAVRGARAVWRGDDVLVELGPRITGLVAPGLGVTHAEVHSRDGAEVLPVDGLGCFDAPVPDGRVRVVLHREAAAPLVSDWLRGSAR
ncbi:hypothetical protein V5P93_007007 [Actinokineospora auranticolor]|uniref:Uncharacterized protein n=1 Tax=Actinokineospora auranticolor TaxID=155976 RepID=A0A2S6GH25_9PSEU|nr:hypothetical protein [Actinokineospora auranticolor]PPK64538.1 hypothetical protein CLV40_119105 [Actinokineospora auranticolor]